MYTCENESLITYEAVADQSLMSINLNKSHLEAPEARGMTKYQQTMKTAAQLLIHCSIIPTMLAFSIDKEEK